MFVIDFFLMIADMIDEVRFGKRVGFGGFLWGAGSVLCLIFAVLFFRFQLNAFGAIGLVGMVACLVCSIVRTWRDIVKNRENEPKSEQRK